MSLMNKAPAGGEGNGGGNGGGEGTSADPTKSGDNPNGGDGGAGGDTTDMSGNKEGSGEFRTPRPDHVPEAFWDVDAGAIKAEDLLKGYTDLEQQLAKAKEKPAAPENYEYKTPEKLRKEFGIQETVSPDDPSYKRYVDFAKEKGYSQEQFSEFLDFYLDTELSIGREQMNAEFAKLGSEKEAIARVKNLRVFGSKHFTPEENQAMASLLNTAESVKLFEKIATLVSKQRQPADGAPKIEGALSESEVDALMKTDAYWDKKHPDYKETHRKVQEGIAKLS